MHLYSIHFHFTLFFLGVFFRPFRPYKYAWKAFYLRFKAVMVVIMVARSGCTFRNIHRHFNIAYSRDSYPWLYASFLSVMTGLTRCCQSEGSHGCHLKRHNQGNGDHWWLSGTCVFLLRGVFDFAENSQGGIILTLIIALSNRSWIRGVADIVDKWLGSKITVVA